MVWDISDVLKRRMGIVNQGTETPAAIAFVAFIKGLLVLFWFKNFTTALRVNPLEPYSPKG